MKNTWAAHAKQLALVTISWLSCRLKLRELLLPKVVDRGQLRETRARPSNGVSNGAASNIWAVPADLFPCALPQRTQRLADEVCLCVCWSIALLTVQETCARPCSGANGAVSTIWAAPADLSPCALPQRTQRLADEV